MSGKKSKGEKKAEKTKNEREGAVIEERAFRSL